MSKRQGGGNPGALAVIVIIAGVFSVTGCGENGFNDADSLVPGTTKYTLQEGSEILSNGQREALSGTLELGENSVQPNSQFSFPIRRIAFTSASVAISGSEGFLSAIYDDPPLTLSSNVLIDGTAIQLFGNGGRENFSGFPPTLIGLRVSGGGYTITLFATPDR